MNYKCGHPAATINRLFGKIHPDRHVELLLIDQVYPTVPCYGCLKKLYEENPDHAELGFKPWHKGAAASTKAYAHFLRHLAIMTAMSCKRHIIVPRYWIRDIFGIEDNFPVTYEQKENKDG